MSTATIHVVGGGGIGSFLLRDLVRLQKTNQLIAIDGTDYNTIIYDEDDVEQKNLLYQDFGDEDILEPKAKVLGERHGIPYMEMFVENVADIIGTNQDIVVCCVDNVKFRSHLYEWQTNAQNFWIDLRSHGRIIVRICRDRKNDLEYLMRTLPDKEQEDDGSCQRAIDLEKGIIQMGNRIIATIGCQTILNYIRGIAQDSRFTRQF
jgi:molybdopterin/thiamine biosynthesis adenylyltransferase